jgi:predicted dehydrogenase
MAIRVGIVGFGFMGKMHTRILASHPDVEVVAVCDENPNAFSKENLALAGNIATGSVDTIDFDRIELYQDYDAFLDDAGLDLVDICLPTFLHCRFTVKALEQGKHVICEKPIALNLDEAGQMIKAAEKGEKSLFMAHCIRYWPEYAWLKQALDEKRYGAVKAAFFKRISASPIGGAWMRDQKAGGDVVLDMHIHDTDFICHLFGEPVDVQSRATSVLTPVPDVVSTHYIYDDIPVVHAIGSWGSPDGYEFEMSYTILCEKATIKYSSCQTPTLKVYGIDGVVAVPEIAEGDGYMHELYDFIDCIKKQRVCSVITPQQASLALSVVLKETQSAKGLNQFKM